VWGGLWRIRPATAHLWFEEIISGDEYEDIDVVIEHIAKADWYARVMLEGGESSEGIFYPLKDETLRQNIIEVRKNIADFKQITLERWNNRESAGIGTDIDQKYDRAFRDFIEKAASIETDLQRALTHQFKNFQMFQCTLIGVCILVTITIAGAIGKLLHRQVRDKALLNSMNHQLNATNQQLIAGEQQLSAANRQLRAKEQQLLSLNHNMNERVKELNGLPCRMHGRVVCFGVCRSDSVKCIWEIPARSRRTCIASTRNCYCIVPAGGCALGRGGLGHDPCS
jgi:hypothetical protein